jgi:hypothetical protein
MPAQGELIHDRDEVAVVNSDLARTPPLVNDTDSIHQHNVSRSISDQDLIIA